MPDRKYEKSCKNADDDADKMMIQFQSWVIIIHYRLGQNKEKEAGIGLPILKITIALINSK